MMVADDPYDLQRFVDAQAGGTHEAALSELRSAHKHSHWMWFVFPQLAGLGHSSMARRYGITGLGEARAYLAHPLLGTRLNECARALSALEPRHSATAIFGSPDDLKLRSSLTLFARAAGPASVFEQLLEKYFAGHGDDLTVAMLQLQHPD